MAAVIAAGELPLWVRFAVRRGSRRSTALSQTIVSASLGVLLVIGGASLVTGAVETGSESVLGLSASGLGWLALCGGLAAAGAGLWAGLAIRWAGRNGSWVQPADQAPSAHRPQV
jgi:hypothetical protein